jgi:hypothetical protein
LILVFACASAPHSTTQRPPATPVAFAKGQVSVKILAEPSDGAPPPDRHQEVQGVVPLHELDLPDYPPAPLAAHSPPATVAVRILIDTDGRVVQVTDSPKEESSTGPFAADFRDAVERAVRRWRFVPAWIEWLRDGKDLDGDGKPDYQIVETYAKTSMTLDYRFEFRIVRGAGEVRGSASPPAPGK